MARQPRFMQYRSRGHAQQFAVYRLRGIHANLAGLYYELRKVDPNITNKIGLAMDCIADLRMEVENVRD